MEADPPQKELAVLVSAPPALIDEAAQHHEQVWRIWDFVDDDELVGAAVQKQDRISQLVPVSGIFEIQVDGRCGCSYGARQGRLADLARAEQSHGGVDREVVQNLCMEPATAQV